MTLAKAFLAEPQLPEIYEADEEVKALIDMARKLEGVTRNAGKHAGGWLSRRPKLPILRRFTAMKRANIRSPSFIVMLNTPDW
ncbi:hypothetical protein ACNKHT_01285 [Shigella flexneri]